MVRDYSSFRLESTRGAGSAEKTDLKIVSESDSEYAILQIDFANKNCPRGTSEPEFSTIGRVRVEDSQQVSAIKLLLEKLYPGNDRLFQRERSGKIKASGPV